jgi:hypothetical protein
MAFCRSMGCSILLPILGGPPIMPADPKSAGVSSWDVKQFDWVRDNIVGVPGLEFRGCWVQCQLAYWQCSLRLSVLPCYFVTSLHFISLISDHLRYDYMLFCFLKCPCLLSLHDVNSLHVLTHHYIVTISYFVTSSYMRTHTHTPLLCCVAYCDSLSLDYITFLDNEVSQWWFI